MSRSKIIKKWLVLKFKRDCIKVMKTKYSEDPNVNALTVGTAILMLHANLRVRISKSAESKFAIGGSVTPVNICPGERILSEEELNKIRSLIR